MKNFVIAICIVFINSSVFAKQKKFKTKKALCSFIEEQKNNAEERMLRGYTVKQYNKLEANRKYWKNKYIDNCF